MQSYRKVFGQDIQYLISRLLVFVNKGIGKGREWDTFHLKPARESYRAEFHELVQCRSHVIDDES